MRKIFVALVAVLFLIPHAANAGGPGVSMTNGLRFDPDPVHLGVVSESITWTNTSTGIGHTSTSDIGLPSWDSGLKSPTQTFTYVFVTAGTLTYHCEVHRADGMVGTVTVPMSASPTTGVAGSTHFQIDWASGAVSGFHFDVQRAKPKNDFKNLYHDVDFEGVSNVVLSKKGTYKFRARVRNTTTGEKSGYSPVLKIKVL